MMAILKRLLFFWKKRGRSTEIDYTAGYREPWIEQSIRDFEKRLKD